MATFLALTLAGTAAADEGPGLGLGLLPGWNGADGARRAALEISLSPGWRTYWRSPGEAGLTPRLDWSRSENVAAVEVIWPRPSAFETGGRGSWGYEGGVTLPIVVTPRDAAAPIRLSVVAEIGVCRTLCLAAKAEAALDIGAAEEMARSRVADAFAATPLPAAEAGARMLDCRLRGAGGVRRLDATLEDPAARGGSPEVAIAGPAGVLFRDVRADESMGRVIVEAEAEARPAGRWIARDELGLLLLWPDRAVWFEGCRPGA